MNSLLRVGLLGSWYRIWATSSLRKVSFPIWSVRSAVDVAVVVGVPTAPIGLVIGRSPGQTRTSTPEDADWSVGRAAPPSPGRSGEEPQARGRESCWPGWPEPPCWPARESSSCCWALRRLAPPTRLDGGAARRG